MQIKNTKHKAIRKAPFTLLELMVSMGIFSILMLMLMMFFNGAQKIWTTSEQRNSTFADVRVAMDLMASNLQSALYDYNQIPFRVIKKSPDPLPAATTAYKPYDMIYFVTNSSYKFDNSLSNTYKVKYYVDNITTASPGHNLKVAFIGDNKGAALWNYVSNPPSQTILSDLLDVVANTTVQTIIPYVTEFKITCFYKCGRVIPDTTMFPTTLPTGETADNILEFPYAVQIKLSVLDKINYQKWQNVGFDAASEFKLNNERSFFRMIYIGERGQWNGL